MQQPERLTEKGVKASIFDSFSTTQYPVPNRLTVLNRDPDFAEAADRLRNKSRQELLAHLEELKELAGPEFYWYTWIFSMLTPGAFYYFLSALLIKK